MVYHPHYIIIPVKASRCNLIQNILILRVFYSYFACKINYFQ